MPLSPGGECSSIATSPCPDGMHGMDVAHGIDRLKHAVIALEEKVNPCGEDNSLLSQVGSDFNQSQWSFLQSQVASISQEMGGLRQQFSAVQLAIAQSETRQK